MCLFTEFAKTNLSKVDQNKSIDNIINELIEHITNAANKVIGERKLRQRKKTVPWLNKNCEIAIKDNKKALYKYRRNNNLDNLVALKKAQANLRRTIINSKKVSWENFVSTISCNTPVQIVWDKIRKIKGGKGIQQTTALKSQNKVITNNQEIANLLADTFENNSNDSNYYSEFLIYKHKIEASSTSYENKNLYNPINELFTYNEMLYVLRNSRENSSPGSDGIAYEFIKHLPEETLRYLLNSTYSKAE